MAQSRWVHISITLPVESDVVTVRKVALACLHEEGLDEAAGPGARGLSLERGVDGAPRLVGGSALPVLLRGDPFPGPGHGLGDVIRACLARCAPSIHGANTSLPVKGGRPG